MFFWPSYVMVDCYFYFYHLNNSIQIHPLKKRKRRYVMWVYLKRRSKYVWSVWKTNRFSPSNERRLFWMKERWNSLRLKTASSLFNHVFQSLWCWTEFAHIPFIFPSFREPILNCIQNQKRWNWPFWKPFQRHILAQGRFGKVISQFSILPKNIVSLQQKVLKKMVVIGKKIVGFRQKIAGFWQNIPVIGLKFSISLMWNSLN